MNRLLVAAVARRSKLPHPAAILLAEGLYRDETARWVQSRPSFVRAWAARRLDETASVLFNAAS
jgi:hypothetical protein